jgi:MoxR-like ATPase
MHIQSIQTLKYLLLLTIQAMTHKKLLGNASQIEFRDIKGQEAIKHALKSALMVDRHVLIVGPPGVGKTTLARNVAKILPGKSNTKSNIKSDTKSDTNFVRIQGSPDLTVEDLLGDIDPVKALKFGASSKEAFSPGKIFKADNGVLFFDELNRCPEKLQNALLQVLEEGKATIGSYDVDIPANFIFIATMNPQDTSTEKLSDVLLDRFDVLYMSYPETQEIEESVVIEKGSKTDAKVPQQVVKYLVGFVRLLRSNDKLEKVPGVRGSLGLYERSQTNALLSNRKTVIVEDVKAVAVSVLAHRIKLRPSVAYLQSAEKLVQEEAEKFFESPKEGGLG